MCFDSTTSDKTETTLFCRGRPQRFAHCIPPTYCKKEYFKLSNDRCNGVCFKAETSWREQNPCLEENNLKKGRYRTVYDRSVYTRGHIIYFHKRWSGRCKLHTRRNIDINASCAWKFEYHSVPVKHTYFRKYKIRYLHIYMKRGYFLYCYNLLYSWNDIACCKILSVYVTLSRSKIEQSIITFVNSYPQSQNCLIIGRHVYM
jgi:hypothetical protein